MIRFQKLYEVERVIRDWNFSPEDALELRQRQSEETLKEFKKWLTDEYQKVLPSSAIGKAISYSLPCCEKLSLYTTNGSLQIDNNPVENAITTIAIGLKNYLFAGSHDADQGAALL